MNVEQKNRVLRLAALTLAVAGAVDSMAATRIDLGQAGLQRDAVMSSADLRPTTASVVTADGSVKVKYQQFYQGVRVWNETAPVARKTTGALADAPSFTHGTLVEGIAADIPSTKPRLSRDDIRRLMRINAGQQGHAVANAEHEDIELVVRLDESGRAQLVYLASMHLHGNNPSSPSFIFDANSGNIISSWDGLMHRDAHGPGGNEKLGKYYYGKDFKPLNVTQDCVFDNENVTTIDMGNGTAEVSKPFKMANCPASGTPENTARAINGAFSPENDGHYYGGVIFNMYKEWYNTRPIEQKLTVRVHYGNNYQNAFWNGRSMTFGDGGSSMYPLVSLGVMAHEVSHGYTQQNSGLIYKGMSGGMNEAFSDMAAQAAEEYMFGKPTFLIGGEIVKGGADKALRYMMDPEKDGKSIGHASKFTDRLNVHYSSGVYNKAFALLATTSGWSARKAFEIMVIANKLYWKPNSTFNEGACGVVQAAKDKGYKSEDVVAAFSKVGVSCDGTTPPQPSTKELKSGIAVTGLDIAANGKAVYTIDVPANTSFLAVRTGAGAGDANVYVKFGAEPTTSNADASSAGQANAEYALIKSPKAGRYYVLVQAPAAVSGLSLIAVAR
ncbi:M4 family metallopeptidase [Parachitinimonas caeni]|uniref:Neutral metalloproteinase n=1 Tax=Parachitinimonas caeni TaxID=3031301 RepID=A0ABT7E2A5_9NEIS|nr:M4 family metallopeptidase [Parachitinimonas caeni]MDK2126453.1 M4 family metallopeptidase [Parachitinimonas caeni]